VETPASAAVETSAAAVETPASAAAMRRVGEARLAERGSAQQSSCGAPQSPSSPGLGSIYSRVLHRRLLSIPAAPRSSAAPDAALRLRCRFMCCRPPIATNHSR
jgi:hypothetical protein